jgi:hypothetical protein
MDIGGKEGAANDTVPVTPVSRANWILLTTSVEAIAGKVTVRDTEAVPIGNDKGVTTGYVAAIGLSPVSLTYRVSARCVADRATENVMLLPATTLLGSPVNPI